MKDEFEKCLKMFQEKARSILEKLHHNSEDKEAKKEAESLAEETGLTFSFVEEVCDSDDESYVKWKLFIPMNAGRFAEIAQHEHQTFMFGEAEGHEKGCWEYSWSC